MANAALDLSILSSLTAKKLDT
jgi:hypothetical protein